MQKGKFARKGLTQLLKMLGPQQPKTLANPPADLVENTARMITPKQAIEQTDLKPEFVRKALPFYDKYTGKTDYSGNAKEFLEKANNVGEMRLRLNTLLHDFTTYDDVSSWVQGTRHYPYADGVRDKIRNGLLVENTPAIRYYDKVVLNRKLAQLRKFRETYGFSKPLPEGLRGLE